jgi:hypothetical protein
MEIKKLGIHGTCLHIAWATNYTASVVSLSDEQPLSLLHLDREHGDNT